MSLFNKKQSDIPRRRLAERAIENSTSPNVFKRNRTLTGSTSNHLGGIDAKSDLESPRTHVHNLSIQRRKVASILSIVLVTIAFFWMLVSNFTASVVVNVSDASISKPIDLSMYEKVIQDYFGANPVSRLSFFLDQSALTAYVSGKLPEVSSVSKRNMVGIGRTNFSITMRTPVAGWQINSKQYYVDSKGIPFEKDYFGAPVVQIVDNSGIAALQTGTVAIASNRFLSFVGRVVYLSKQNGYTVTQAALPANTTRELEIRLKEGNYLVKLSIDRQVGEQVEDMVAAVRYFTNHNQTPEYIDVRVSGKAFYR